MAESSLRAAGNLARLGEVLALHALLGEQLDDLVAATQYARQALDLLPAGETLWRSIAQGVLSMEAVLAGRFADAQQAIQEARVSYAAIDNSYGQRGALILLGSVALGQGQLSRADTLFREVLDTAGEDRSDRGTALMEIAALCYERGQLAAAEQYAQEAHVLSAELGYELLHFALVE